MHTETFLSIDEIKKALQKKINDLEWYVKSQFKQKNVLEEIETLKQLKNALKAFR